MPLAGDEGRALASWNQDNMQTPIHRYPVLTSLNSTALLRTPLLEHGLTLQQGTSDPCHEASSTTLLAPWAQLHSSSAADAR